MYTFKGTFNRLHHFHTSLLTTALLSLAVIAFSTMPFGVSVTPFGLSFEKKAFAFEKNEMNAHKQSVQHDTTQPSPVARAHASIKSVIGVLAFFDQSIISSFENTTKSGELDLAIAELELQLENSDLGDEARAPIEADLVIARKKADALGEEDAIMAATTDDEVLVAAVTLGYSKPDSRVATNPASTPNKVVRLNRLIGASERLRGRIFRFMPYSRW